MTDSANHSDRRPERLRYLIAAFGIGVYFINIAIGMAAVKLGWGVTRLNDIWEFLIVLVSMMFFVAGLMAAEERRSQDPQ